MDNIDPDHQADVEGPQAYAIEPFLPPADQGSILITTCLPYLEACGAATKVTRVGRNKLSEPLRTNHSSLSLLLVILYFDNSFPEIKVELMDVRR